MTTTDTLEHEVAALERTVDQFAQVMKTKLKRKAREGYAGWDDPAFRAIIENKLMDHAQRLVAGGDRQQAVDVANLAMMLWFMDWKAAVEDIAP